MLMFMLQLSQPVDKLLILTLACVASEVRLNQAVD